MKTTTVLLTGAGAPGAAGILKSLHGMDDRKVRVVGVDMDPDAYGFAFTDEQYVVPAGDATDYVPRLETIAKREQPDVILPLTTNELQPLATHRDRFEQPIMVSPAEALRAANDKANLYQFLANRDFDSAPDFHRVESKTAFLDALEDLGYPEQPVCFKPPVSSGMRGFRILDERTDRLDRLLETKPGTPITTADEILPVLSAADSFPPLVVMEYLPGDEYSVDVLAMGESVGPVVPRTRSRTRAGITFEGTVEENEDLIDAAGSICRELGLEYNINLQFKYDGSGTPKVIEINPRVSGTIVMCVGAGVNLPALGVKYALGEPVPPQEIKWGTEMVRYWSELFTMPDGETFQLPALRR